MESIQKLLEADYTDFADDALDYPDLSSLEKKRRLKPPKATKASQGHDTRTKPPPVDKLPFKMKRFQNVAPRVVIPPAGGTAAVSTSGANNNSPAGPASPCED